MEQTLIAKLQKRVFTVGASIVKPESTKLLQRLAEKEFEKRFSAVCAVVQEPIYLRKSAMLNSPFLVKVVEKINSERKIIELVEDGTTGQQGKNANGKSDLKTVSDSVVPPKSTNGSD